MEYDRRDSSNSRAENLNITFSDWIYAFSIVKKKFLHSGLKNDLLFGSSLFVLSRHDSLEL